MKAAVLAFACMLGAATAAKPYEARVTPLVLPPASPVPASQANDPTVVCGFRNPGYTGLCEEKAPYVKGKKIKDLCTPILDCLNNPRCIKTYCRNTTIRQGWSLDSAKRAK